MNHRHAQSPLDPKSGWFDDVEEGREEGGDFYMANYKSR